MEFTSSKQVFSDALSKLQSIIPKKAIIPILSFIRVESDGQDLKLTGTNLENTIYSYVSDKMLAVSEPGVMCVPAKQLFDIARLMPDGPIKVTSDANDWVHVLGKGARFKIPGSNAGQFPDLPNYDTVEWIMLPAKALDDMLAGVRFAAADSDSVIHTKGVQLEVHGDTVLVVATDGSRIALASAKLPQGPAVELEVFIPTDGLSELVKMTAGAGDKEMIGVGTNGNNLFFRSATQALATRHTVTKFPNYTIPFQECGSFQFSCSFRADTLVQPIKRALLTADKKSSSIIMDFKGSALRLSATDADLGEAEQFVETNFNGELRIACNGLYLLEYLEPVGPGVASLQLHSKDKQMYFVAQRDGVDFYYCLMPMRE